jgi:hypothetical protein
MHGVAPAIARVAKVIAKGENANQGAEMKIHESDP